MVVYHYVSEFVITNVGIHAQFFDIYAFLHFYMHAWLCLHTLDCQPRRDLNVMINVADGVLRNAHQTKVV